MTKVRCPIIRWSGQESQKQLNASRDAALDIGAAGVGQKAAAARLALLKRDPMDVDFLAGQRGRLGEADEVRGEAPRPGRLPALGTVRDVPVRGIVGTSTPDLA